MSTWGHDSKSGTEPELGRLMLSNTLSENAGVQQLVVSAQAHHHATFRPDCESYGRRYHANGRWPHRIATLFGEVRVELPWLAGAGCGCGETGVRWPSHCRSTPGLEKLQARLSALMPYRVAADLLQHPLPIDAGTSPETLRSHSRWCANRPMVVPLLPRLVAGGVGKADAAAVRSACARRW